MGKSPRMQHRDRDRKGGWEIRETKQDRFPCFICVSERFLLKRGMEALFRKMVENFPKLGLMEYPLLPLGRSQTAPYDPDTQQVIPEGTASLVDWMKATAKSVYPEKGDCQLSLQIPSATPRRKQLIWFIRKLCGIGFMIIRIFTHWICSLFGSW